MPQMSLISRPRPLLSPYTAEATLLPLHTSVDMSTEALLQKYQGHIVPQSYDAGFVALSYVVSLVGAGSTLELINRRTGFRGLFNQYVYNRVVKNPSKNSTN